MGGRQPCPHEDARLEDAERRRLRGCGRLRGRAPAHDLVPRVEPGQRAVPADRPRDPRLESGAGPRRRDAAAALDDRGAAEGPRAPRVPRRVHRAPADAGRPGRAAVGGRCQGRLPAGRAEHGGGPRGRLLPRVPEPGQRVRGRAGVRRDERARRGRHDRAVGPPRRPRPPGDRRGVRSGSGHRRVARPHPDGAAARAPGRRPRPRGRRRGARIPRRRLAHERTPPRCAR